MKECVVGKYQFIPADNRLDIKPEDIMGQPKTDLEKFMELFNSVGVKYELDQTAENLDYITLITKYGSKIFLFLKTGKFSYEDFWPYS